MTHQPLCRELCAVGKAAEGPKLFAEARRTMCKPATELLKLRSSTGALPHGCEPAEQIFAGSM